MRTYIWSTLLAAMLGSVAQAGNVSAYVSGGHLYLYGDAGGSSLTVDSPASGQIQVTGTVTPTGESTVVNGQANGTVVLSGWTRGIYSYGYAGDDTLVLSGLMVNGHTHIDLGDGNDALVVGELPTDQPTEFQADINTAAFSTMQSLVVLGGRGNDMVMLNNLFVQGGATFDLGAGEDDVFIGGSNDETNNDGSPTVSFYESCVIIPGSEADDISIASTSVRRNLIVDDSSGPMLLEITDVSVDDSTFIYGTPSNDRIITENLTVANILKVIAEGGDDVIMLNSSSNSTEVYPGAGNDSVELMAVTTNRAYVYLDPGNDALQIQGGSYNFLYGYGSSGNDLFQVQSAMIGQANLYGESGTDTYSDGGGNSIGKLNLYTIENT